MRIGINALPLAMEHFSGISNYVNEVLKVWAKNPGNDEVYLISTKPIHTDFELPGNWHVIIEAGQKGIIWETLGVIKNIKDLSLDVYWGTNYILPLFRVKKCRYFVTVYDLALMRFPEAGIFKLKLRAHYLAKHSAKIADGVMTISEASASDIKEFFKTPEDRLTVTYCGRGTGRTEFSGVTTADDSVTAADGEPYFLFISTLEPRKNIINIIKGYERYTEMVLADNSETASKKLRKLVLAGGNGWKSDELDRTLEQSPVRDRISLPGYVSAEEKDELLRHATAFVYPSLYEGFGLPILEAMAYGLPVITTAVSSMPEVGGDAALYIDDPSDYEELAERMLYIAELQDAVHAEPASGMEYNGLQDVVSAGAGEASSGAGVTDSGIVEDPVSVIAAMRDRMKLQLRKFSWEKTASVIMENFKQSKPMERK